MHASESAHPDYRSELISETFSSGDEDGEIVAYDVVN